MKTERPQSEILVSPPPTPFVSTGLSAIFICFGQQCLHVEAFHETDARQLRVENIALYLSDNRALAADVIYVHSSALIKKRLTIDRTASELQFFAIS